MKDYTFFKYRPTYFFEVIFSGKLMRSSLCGECGEHKPKTRNVRKKCCITKVYRF